MTLIRSVLKLSSLSTNLSSSAVGPGDASQLIDLLLGAADFSPVEVDTPSLPDQLEAAMGLQ